MAFLTALSYLLAYPVVLVTCLLVLVVLHEAGHALAALAIVPGQVGVFIGQSGHPARTWQLRWGRLSLCASRRLLDWRRGGYCKFSPAATWGQAFILLAGPAFPLLIASAGFYTSMHVENGTHRLVTLLFLFLTVVSTIQNLFLGTSTIRGSNGQRILTDGQQLRRLLFPSPQGRQAALALRHFAAGRHAESALLYQQLLLAPAPEVHFFQHFIYCCTHLRWYEEGLRADDRFRQEQAASYTDADRSNGALLLLQTQQLAPALAIYTALLAQERPYPGAYNNRGFVYSEMGEHALAIADFDRAIAVGTHVAEAYCNRGYSWLKLGQPTAALRDLQQSLRLASTAAATHANLGLYYFDEQDYSRALSFFERAHQLDPTTPELADYLLKTRQYLEEASGTGGPL